MGLPDTITSYESCREAMDRALEAERGVRVKRASRNDAINFRQRCYKFRKLVREKNLLIYEKDHPLYGASVYDNLRITVAEATGDVLIEKEAADNLQIEEL